MRNERGAILIVVLMMTAILLILTSVATRMTMLSRHANSQVKKQLQSEADRLPPLK